ILAIIFLNALIGFMQEYKADKAIAALKKLVGLRADVLRNGERKQVDARLLVPGDIVFLEMGDKAPADSRLVEEVNLELQESALTGESVPVRKQVCVVERTAQIAERKNMVFSGTTVTKGRAKGVVVKTGMQTEVGRIATLMQETEEPPTPLQKKFDSFGKRIGYATLLISAIVFAVMVVRKGGNVSELLELFKVAVSLAVAAIPEGLPAIVTLTLALGVQKMARRNVLVRKLTSVETLGSTTVICTDKTGTLTVNQMSVVKLYVNDDEINVAGEGYSLKGNVEKVDESVKLLLRIGTLCNDASLTQGNVTGDPTEAALLVSAAKAGIDADKIRAEFKRVAEVPFDPIRKRMSTAHLIRGKEVLYSKGAPDVVLNLCSHVYISGKVVPLT
ncbi:MAG: HAD-IC family P-type ATPase, partial [Nanoarchaeota archaeon]